MHTDVHIIDNISFVHVVMHSILVGSLHINVHVYSTAQRKGKRIPRAIRVRSADRVLIVRGSVIVNPRVITSSPRAARGSISAEVHAAIIANAQANIALVRVCTYAVCVGADFVRKLINASTWRARARASAGRARPRQFRVRNDNYRGCVYFRPRLTASRPRVIRGCRLPFR